MTRAFLVNVTEYLEIVNAQGDLMSSILLLQAKVDMLTKEMKKRTQWFDHCEKNLYVRLAHTFFISLLCSLTRLCSFTELYLIS